MMLDADIVAVTSSQRVARVEPSGTAAEIEPEAIEEGAWVRALTTGTSSFHCRPSSPGFAQLSLRIGFNR
jgi:hypothetical protein